MSFLKSGYRKSLMTQKQTTKKHIKAFYKILEDLDIVAKQISEKYIKELTNKLINEDNILEYAKEFTDIPLERMESNILLAKLDIIREHNAKNKS